MRKFPYILPSRGCALARYGYKRRDHQLEWSINVKNNDKLNKSKRYPYLLWKSVHVPLHWRGLRHHRSHMMRNNRGESWHFFLYICLGCGFFFCTHFFSSVDDVVIVLLIDINCHLSVSCLWLNQGKSFDPALTIVFSIKQQVNSYQKEPPFKGGLLGSYNGKRKPTAQGTHAENRKPLST